MNAVYTDIVVHFLVDDDRSQTERACEIIESGDIFVCTTVLLEVEWVLRSVYKLAAAEISTALKLFCGLPRVVLQNESALRRALIWMDGGLDFADALHLAICADHDAFVTFDKALVQKRSDWVRANPDRSDASSIPRMQADRDDFRTHARPDAPHALGRVPEGQGPASGHRIP